MSGLLRALLMGLVALNLAFVHITEAADWTWLGPLAALTIAAPLLIRARSRRPYRWAWNLAVLVAFSQLVQHTSSAGVHHLLEDGLFLAALCQVHLLNNIGPDQKPDLLLFNSFMIAVVVSFLCFEVEYFIVFLAYAPTLVLTMLLLAVPELAARPGRLLRHGLPKALVAVALTLLVFFFLPRDFRRRGLLGDRLELLSPGSAVAVDFSEEVDLARSGEARVSDRVVMRVHLERGDAASVPAHWRGKSFDSFDGSRWRCTGSAERVLTRRRGASSTPVSTVRVRLIDARAETLFLPLRTADFRMSADADSACLVWNPDGTVLLPRSPRRSREPEYLVEVAGDSAGQRVPRYPAPYLRLPRGESVRAAEALARMLVSSMPPDADQSARVERMRHHLANGFRYVMPGEDGSASSLEQFLAGEAGGHCEYFATALAVMLRTQRIPCRLVSGYRSEEWDRERRTLTIRARHAHAWVEVFDPARGWTTVDSTPPVSWDLGGEGEGLLARVGAVLAWVWGKISNFDSEDRDRAFAWLAALPGRAAGSFAARPLPYLVALLAAAALAAVRRRLRNLRVPAAVRAYRRDLRRSGLARRPEETPREVLSRARSSPLPPRRLARIERATARHEAERYSLPPIR